MKLSTLFSTTLSTAAFAMPNPFAAAAVSPRQATGFCEFRIATTLYLSVNIEINNTQDGGVCGGFWDNINGSAGCKAATGRKCEVDGNIKRIFFRAPHSCPMGDIEWIIRAVTEPKVQGVVCVKR